MIIRSQRWRCTNRRHMYHFLRYNCYHCWHSAIITTTAGISTTHSASASLSSISSSTKILALKWLRLRMLCGVTTNAKVPDFCQEVASESTRQNSLAILIQYLFTGIHIFRCNLHVYKYLIQVLPPSIML